jgi:hypothetical protein
LVVAHFASERLYKMAHPLGLATPVRLSGSGEELDIVAPPKGDEQKADSAGSVVKAQQKSFRHEEKF